MRIDDPQTFRMPRRSATAGKRAANVTVSAALLAKAKSLEINLSKTLEDGLLERVRDLEARRWREDNRKAIEAYNARVERDGIWSDGLRGF